MDGFAFAVFKDKIDNIKPEAMTLIISFRLFFSKIIIVACVKIYITQ